MDLAILLVILLIVVLIWRGPKTVRKLGQSFGRGVKAIRDEAQSRTDDSYSDKS